MRFIRGTVLRRGTVFTRGTVLRIAISVGLLALLVLTGGVNVGEVVAAFRSADPSLLVAAFGLYGGAGTLIRGERWRVLVRGLGHRLGLRRAVEIFLVGTCFNQVLPTGIGGDVIRTVMLGREGLGKARAASTVLVERATGMLALLLMGVIAVLIAGDQVPPLVTGFLLGAGLAGLAGAAAMSRAARIRAASVRVPVIGRVAAHGGIARFVDSFGEYSLGTLSRALGWSAVFAGVMVGTNLLLGRAFGLDQVTVGDWAVIVPLVALSLLVPSIAGLGVREWSYVGLLGALNPPVSAGTAAALSLAFHGLNLVLAAIGGIIGLLEGVPDTDAQGAPSPTRAGRRERSVSRPTDQDSPGRPSS